MKKKENKKDLTLDTIRIPDSMERFTKELPNRYRKGEFDQSRIKNVDMEYKAFQQSLKKKWSWKKKVITGSLSAAASLMLLLGSGFVSPTMAKMLSKIPPISSIYEEVQQQPDLSELITNALKKEGYPVQQVKEAVGISEGDLFIYLDASDKYIKNEKPAIDKIAFNILHGEKFQGTKYEDYSVKVRKYIPLSEEWRKEDARIDKESSELLELVRPIVNSYGYQAIGISGNLDIVELELPNTSSKEKVAEIQNAVEKALKENGKEHVTVKTTIFNQEKREQYSHWSEAVVSIAREFTTFKKYQVSGVGYKSKDGVMQIIITLKVKSTDPEAAKLVAELNTMVEEFIQTDEIQKQVKDDPYEIIFRDKDNKKIK